jgi:hypothetical protein
MYNCILKCGGKTQNDCGKRKDCPIYKDIVKASIPPKDGGVPLTQNHFSYFENNFCIKNKY